MKEKQKIGALLLPAIVFAVSLAVYANALSNDFIYDDRPQILENPWIRDVRYLPRIFLINVAGFDRSQSISNYYRPMMHVIYMFNYHLFGMRPLGFHLVNILFHAANSVLVFFILSRLLGGKPREAASRQPESRQSSSYSLPPPSSFRVLPFIAALLFAVHPVHTEAVTWIAGLPELSFTLFSLLSFYFYSKSLSPSGRDIFLSCLFFLLAVLSKETGLTLLLVLVSYDYALRREKGRVSLRVKTYIPFAVVAVGYLVARTSALGGFAPIKRHAELSTYEYVINVFPLFVQYAGKLLLPIHLNAFYVLHPISSLVTVKGLMGLSAVAAFVVACAVSFKRDRKVFFGLLLFALPLLPVFYIPGVGENTFAERYLYFPSVGFVIVAAVAAIRIASLKRTSFVVTSLFAAVAVLYAAGTVVRNPVWKNENALYSDAIRKSPDAAGVRNNFGMVLIGEGRLDEAVEQLRAAIALEPADPAAHTNLAVAYTRKGLPQKAAEELRRVLEITPFDLDARLNLGVAYAMMGSLHDAVDQFRMVLSADPASAKAHFNIALTYSRQGRTDEAIEEFEAALRLRPDHPNTHYNLGLAYARKGLLKEAITHYRAALAEAPAFADAHYQMGVALANTGQRKEAIEHFAAAVGLNPGNASYHNILGISYGQEGERDKAISEFEAAVRLAPGEPAYRRNLEKARALNSGMVSRP